MFGTHTLAPDLDLEEEELELLDDDLELELEEELDDNKDILRRSGLPRADRVGVVLALVWDLVLRNNLTGSLVRLDLDRDDLSLATKLGFNLSRPIFTT